MNRKRIWFALCTPVGSTSVMRAQNGDKTRKFLGDNFAFQQDGAPPHWMLDVREYLNIELPNRWILF
ncbi:hypothetical protein ANN_06205 [Periplaneta americana]|uniref:Uncharacterized protein n=1 Tax=Periplaneta americana TaxID=6978 RepID=A0ABQ8TDT0_PERAM|nr:hypothetical protein ANN_06205 [Periplaneta americana]